jgi:hypothetical protein
MGSKNLFADHERKYIRRRSITEYVIFSKKYKSAVKKGEESFVSNCRVGVRTISPPYSPNQFLIEPDSLDTEKYTGAVYTWTI